MKRIFLFILLGGSLSLFGCSWFGTQPVVSKTTMCTPETLSVCENVWEHAISHSTYPASKGKNLFKCEPYTPNSNKGGCYVAPETEGSSTIVLHSKPGDAVTFNSLLCLVAKDKATDRGCHALACSQEGMTTDPFGKRCQLYPYQKMGVSVKTVLQPAERGWWRRSPIHRRLKVKYDEKAGPFSPDALLGLEIYFTAMPTKGIVGENVNDSIKAWTVWMKKNSLSQPHFLPVNLAPPPWKASALNDIGNYVTYDFFLLALKDRGTVENKKLLDRAKQPPKDINSKEWQRFVDDCIYDPASDSSHFDKLIYTGNQLYLPIEGACPLTDKTLDQCVIRPENYARMYHIWNYRGLEPTCPMRFWNQVGLNSDDLAALEDSLDSGTGLNLAAMDVMMRMALTERGQGIPYELAKETVVLKQKELDGGHGENSLNPFFDYLGAYSLEQKILPSNVTNIAQDLINKCVRDTVEDYLCPSSSTNPNGKEQCAPNKGNNWAWQRAGWNKSETPPWDNSWGWDCLFMARLLANPDWPKAL